MRRTLFLFLCLSFLLPLTAQDSPGRRTSLWNNDAALFVMGLIVGAGIAHNFGFASGPKGPGPYAATAFAAGMIFCLAVGFMNRGRVSA